MDFKLVHTQWDHVIDDAVAGSNSCLQVACPFIKEKAARRLLQAGTPEQIEIITRFNQRDFHDRVSDLPALRLFLEADARIRGIRNLHAKLYLFGKRRAIVTSANLTEAALRRNHELGFVASEKEIVRQCCDYFDRLWKRAGPDLTSSRLEEWEARLAAVRAGSSRPSMIAGLADEGIDVGLSADPSNGASMATEGPQAFVKFWGQSTNRAGWDEPVLEEVHRAGCHWACTYPKGKRPRQPKKDAIMFMGRLVSKPEDTLIFGRAVALHEHREGKDDATEAEMMERPWKERWPHYVRVGQAEFVAGAFRNGVPLSQLMDELQHAAFSSTKRHATEGSGNTNPRTAYMQQPAVELSREGFVWLNAKLNEAFQVSGRIPAVELDQLDWPRGPGIRVGV